MLNVRMSGIALLVLQATCAHASMPRLTPPPESVTVRSCIDRARGQDEEAIEMWGVQQDGGGSYQLGIHRLTSQCLDELVSDIVGFGSSGGFDDEYCSRHRVFAEILSYFPGGCRSGPWHRGLLAGATL